MRAHRGFSLIEIALSVLILGILLSSLMVPLVAQVQMRQYDATTRQLEEAREALIGFAAARGRLPRPATSATNGGEVASCATEAACTGFLPWATLGLTKLDPYGKIIRYSVTPAFTSTFTMTTIGTKVIQSRLSGVLTNVATGVPAIVWSHGAANWGTTDTGVAMADNSTTNADEDANNSASMVFICREYSNNASGTGGEFDDVCVVLSVHTLVGRMVSAGKLP